jgi:curved DNA-binding protein CbpA
MIKDHYKTLGIQRESPLEDVKKAYRSLALKWHPDVNKGSDAHEKFIEINEAYLILSDKEAKQKYDYEYDNYIKVSVDDFVSKASNMSQTYEYSTYSDSNLNDWSKTARKQAEKYASMSFKDFSNLIKEVIKETSIQGFTAIIYAISGILGANAIFSLIIGLRDSKPEKIGLAFVFIIISIVGFIFTSKKYNHEKN